MGGGGPKKWAVRETSVVLKASNVAKMTEIPISSETKEALSWTKKTLDSILLALMIPPTSPGPLLPVAREPEIGDRELESKPV